MMRSLDIGATGMAAQQMNVDVISNNIANMTTSGFKRQRLEFQDLLYQDLRRPGATSSDSGTIVPTGIQLGLGVRPVATVRSHEQGAILLTESTLDWAINGEGFFQIQLPNGETAYTRSGAFAVNGDGELVTQQGYLLEPTITIPADATTIEVNESGEVLVKIPGTINMQNVGQIQLATFINPAGLDAIGDTMFLETEASGGVTTGSPNSENFGKIQQGAIEQSNVNVVEEITRLIAAQRSYEMNSNVISTSDEMLNTVNQLR
jgi:flagellar basal-body rod protein FlgG